MERGLADILTLGFVFITLVCSATLLLLWVDFPLRSARERQKQLQCELLYFAVLNWRSKNSNTTFPQHVLENLLGLREGGWENFAEILRFWTSGGKWVRVEVSVENRSWVVTLGDRVDRFYRSQGMLSLLPARGSIIRARMEVDLG